MHVFPAPHEFVQISSRQLGKILFEHSQQIQSDVQCGGAAVVLGSPAGHVLIHDLVEAEDGHLGGDVIGIDLFHRQIILLGDRAQGGVAFVLLIDLEGLNDFFFQLLHLCRINLAHLRVLHHVFDRCLGGDSPFGKGTGGELVAGIAHTVTGGEQPLDRGHAVVTPEVLTFGRCGLKIFRTAYPGPGGPGVGTDEVGLRGHNLGS